MDLLYSLLGPPKQFLCNMSNFWEEDQVDIPECECVRTPDNAPEIDCKSAATCTMTDGMLVCQSCAELIEESTGMDFITEVRHREE